MWGVGVFEECVVEAGNVRHTIRRRSGDYRGVVLLVVGLLVLECYLLSWSLEGFNPGTRWKTMVK